MKVYVARQPIFNQRQQVYAYELLFRSGLDNVFAHSDGDEATSRVIADSFLLLGLARITGGHKAFINFTRDLLVNDYATLLPKESVVIEILESVEPDESVLEAAKRAKDQGYLLALDDFVYGPKYDPLLKLTDIVKVDFTVSGPKERRSLAERGSRLGIKLLAEKVETREEFEEAVRMGYKYFQGYFFAKPNIVSGKGIPGFKLNYLQLLNQIHQPGLDYDDLDKIIRREVSLSFKLLRYINSAAFGLMNKIHSIKQALALLGELNVKKWASLVTLAGMGQDKPDALLVNSLTRAVYCESLAGPVGIKDRASDLFLLGLFSHIEALIDQPMAEIMTALPVADDIKKALQGQENQLRTVFDLVLAHEAGRWDEVFRTAAALGLSEDELPELYLKAVELAEKIFYDQS